MNPYQLPYEPPRCRICGAVSPVGEIHCFACDEKLRVRETTLWQRGHLLVAKSDAVFPPRCLKTNRPCKQFLRVKFSYNGHWNGIIWGTAVLCGAGALFVWLLVDLLFTQKVSLDLPFSEETFHAQRLTILKIMIAAAGGAILFPLAAMCENGVIAVVGMALQVAIAVLALNYVPLLRVEKIEGDFVYINGVSSEFLGSLPQF